MEPVKPCNNCKHSYTDCLQENTQMYGIDYTEITKCLLDKELGDSNCSDFLEYVML